METFPGIAGEVRMGARRQEILCFVPGVLVCEGSDSGPAFFIQERPDTGPVLQPLPGAFAAGFVEQRSDPVFHSGIVRDCQ